MSEDQPKGRVHDILLEVDGWRLVKPLFPDLMSVDSYIVHWDCQAVVNTEMGRHWTNKGGIGLGSKCTKCDEICPEEIQGLEILHNGGI